MSTQHPNDMQLSLDLFAVPADPPPVAVAPVGLVRPALVHLEATPPADRWHLPSKLAGAAWPESMLPPRGIAARWDANMAALEALDATVRVAGAVGDVTAALRAWSGWGGLQSVFQNDPARVRALNTLIFRVAEACNFNPDEAWQQTQAATLTAHYTHPAIAAAMWQLAFKYGYRSGAVLEPGCGAGMFLSLAPATGTQSVGVEIDPVAAAVARALNPGAKVRAESFAKSTLADGAFDLAIGNVPFTDVVLHDPKHNAHRHTLHNHFIVKSLALLKPGAVAVLLTSHFTLDAQNVAARNDMAGLADLVTAIRLPSGAHKAMASTEALTDILVFRRHASAEAAFDYAAARPDWLDTVSVDYDGRSALVNRSLAIGDGRGRVLGVPTVRVGMYGGEQLEVDGDSEPTAIADRIRALFDLPAVVHGNPTGAAAADEGTLAGHDTQAPVSLLSAEPQVDEALEHLDDLWDGHLILARDGLHEVRDGQPVALTVPRTVLGEMKPLLRMRDLARHLLDVEARTTGPDPELEDTRRQLRDAWTAYVKKFGAVNRYQLRRTGRTDPVTQHDRYARVMPKAIRVLLGDPSGALVLSLENFEDETQNTTPAAILTGRVLSHREPVKHVDSPHDALAVCLDQRGRVDLGLIASLLSCSPEQARGALGELVYLDPADQQLVPATEYLSGDVRVKLDVAQDAVLADSAFQVNVDALRQVIPQSLGAEDVDAQIGAVWISDNDHQQFLAEILERRHVVVEHGINNLWTVDHADWGTHATSTWGTVRMPTGKLFKCLLQQNPIEVVDVFDKPGGGTYRVINAEETAAAVEKATALQERFSEWVWEDAERAVRLLDLFNRMFNSIVLRDYSADGERLTLPGMSDALTPAEHQRTAIARIITEPAVGLFHVVGAGKTLVMAAAAWELRRLGLVRKPTLVVPNHMLEQMTREFLQLYPHARVLAASTDDLVKDKRRQFIAKIATNDWDAVIVTRSAFERIPVDLEFEKQYLRAEIDRIKEQIKVNTENEKTRTHNQVQKMLRTREEQLERLADREVDPAVAFDKTGIDYVLVDEAHGYKNLRTESNIRDAAIEGSKRATDLHMKLEYLRSRDGRRVATFATATPIANSVTEAYVMQLYLRPDLLHNVGIHHFDQWAATFGEKVTAVEMAPTGGGNYRIKTRFARFKNVPEMLRLWHVFADVKTADDLNLPRPALVEQPSGQRGPRTVVIPTSPEMKAYIGTLVERAEKCQGGKPVAGEDNMLVITGDGRKAALDLRLVSVSDTARHKLEYAADEIAAIDRKHADRQYLIPGTDVPSPHSGGLQIVFCDLSTPNPDRWNAYDELRALLAQRGIPSDRVRFIHDARNNVEKARLFDACRNGKVSVIIGSTEKMGTGTNIQARATALHHLDCPWRPADLEQRDGRALRQGNQNAELEIVRYVVEQSFDAYNWQTVERKAAFISQVTTGKLDVRAIEDIGDSTMSFAEVKALASGDPLILEHANAMADLQRLQRSKRAWQRNQGQLHFQQQTHRATIDHTEREIDRLHQLLAARTTTDGDPMFEITGQRTQDRYEAARLLRAITDDPRPSETMRQVGTVDGLPVYVSTTFHPISGSIELRVMLDQLQSTIASATRPALKNDPLNLIRHLLDCVDKLDTREPVLLQKIETARLELQRSIDAQGVQFKHQDALDAAAGEVARITKAMEAAQRQRDQAQHAANQAEVENNTEGETDEPIAA